MNQRIFNDERNKIWRLELEGELLPEEIRELFDGADRLVKDTTGRMILFYFPGQEFDTGDNQAPKAAEDNLDRVFPGEEWNAKNSPDCRDDGDDHDV